MFRILFHLLQNKILAPILEKKEKESTDTDMTCACPSWWLKMWRGSNQLQISQMGSGGSIHLEGQYYGH